MKKLLSFLALILLAPAYATAAPLAVFRCQTEYFLKEFKKNTKDIPIDVIGKDYPLSNETKDESVVMTAGINEKDVLMISYTGSDGVQSIWSGSTQAESKITMGFGGAGSENLEQITSVTCTLKRI